jgi:hypothetical protein
MELLITDDMKLYEVQQFFRDIFPYLKLEFFNQNASKETRFHKENMIHDLHKTLHQVRGKHNTGVIDINDHMRASDLENRFLQDYGLLVQVFRKAGNNWLFTTESDTQTLAILNARGEELSHPRVEDELEEDDYHEQL